MAESIDLANYRNRLGLANRLGRVVWGVVWLLFFRPSPIPLHGWRRMLLRCFGARIGPGVHVYPSAKVWAPWNLEMGAHSCLSHHVDCYSVDKIRIGENVTVSQYAYLCAATHDIEDRQLELVTAPIRIEPSAWICAGAFIGPGRTIGEGAVVGARAAVFRDVEPWTVVGGNPARFLKNRVLRSSGESPEPESSHRATPPARST